MVTLTDDAMPFQINRELPAIDVRRARSRTGWEMTDSIGYNQKRKEAPISETAPGHRKSFS